MRTWLKRLIAGHDIERRRRTPANPIVADWDVAQAVEQRDESEPGRVAYQFLGVTGEEET